MQKYNPKISAFQTVIDVNNPFDREVLFLLKRIKTGKSSAKVNQYRKAIESGQKDKAEKIKKQLPAYTFSGTFSKRNNKHIKEYSHLICLDFDNFKSIDEVKKYKENILENPFIFSSFISPSGTGLKVVVKVKSGKDDHLSYFLALQDFFNDEHFDKSGKDIARLCFESYDPDIFINPNCESWDEKKEFGHYNYEDSEHKVNVPITSDYEIINLLEKWFHKNKGMQSGNRNTHIYHYAIALNKYGISESSALNHLTSYSEPGFTVSEIEATTKGVYKRYKTEHKTLFFNDNDAEKNIKKSMYDGDTKKSIVSKFGNDIDDIEIVIENIKSGDQVGNFWKLSKNNAITLVPHKFKVFLEQNNYLKYYPQGGKTFVFIQKDKAIIEEVSDQMIKDFVLYNLHSRTDIGFSPYDYMARNPNFFVDRFLSLIGTAEIDFRKDTLTECYLYYNNCAVKVTKDKVEEIDYFDLEGYVWRNQVIDRNYIKIDSEDAVYKKFIKNVSGGEHENYKAFQTVIGYLLHSFKNNANNKAIILNDEMISDDPNGGSGKGIFWNALSKMKKVSSIDGKTFDFNNSFPYQTVSTDTQILVFDDVKKNFRFENLFSAITEGVTIEYKGKDAIKIPVEQSPKIMITTNYTVGGSGGSHIRRKHEVEFTTHYNSDHTPEDDFGHLFFDDWNESEWNKFDSYMIHCLQLFLKNGLIESTFKNIELRKFINETNSEFLEWCESRELKLNTRYYRGDELNKFLTEYPDYAPGSRYALSAKSFKKYIDKYAHLKGWDSENEKDMIGRYTIFTTGNDEEAKDEFGEPPPF